MDNKFLSILYLTSLQYSCARSIHNPLRYDKQAPRHTNLHPFHFAVQQEDVGLDPFDMEGKVQLSSTTPLIPAVIDLGESGLNRKVLGLPGWEYLTVTLVVVLAVGVGGSVAIVCKKCGGLLGRRGDKDQSST
ncbi:uncharacterized protein LOC125650025 isoform X2 [Ostrea edulis]|uniref:uncharacterized protein LOC125650025 isoform X2 n=1 Tax=Ostrea edulis TaxID=37623 RepID=UPI0024AFBA9A|nr:uncharacterized protein LOC125650025 isoform X2 [Ostrea edulis]